MNWCIARDNSLLTLLLAMPYHFIGDFSTLAKIIACCLRAGSHYLNQTDNFSNVTKTSHGLFPLISPDTLWNNFWHKCYCNWWSDKENLYGNTRFNSNFFPWSVRQWIAAVHLRCDHSRLLTYSEFHHCYHHLLLVQGNVICVIANISGISSKLLWCSRYL